MEHRTRRRVVLLVCLVVFGVAATSAVGIGTIAAQSDGPSEQVTVAVEAGPIGPGTNTTISVPVTNTGPNETAVIVDADLPANWTVVDRADDGGEYKPANRSWLWQTLDASETRSPSLTVRVPSNASGSSYTVSAAAKVDGGVANTATRTVLPRLRPPRSVDFGTVSLVNSSTTELTISNDAAEQAEVVTATVSGADADEFSINRSQLPVAVPAGGSRTVSVTFNATTRGASTAVLNLTANRSKLSPPEITLNGTGVVGTPLTTNTSSVSFGGIAVGNRTSRQVRLSNDAPAEIAVDGVSVSGDAASEFATTNVSATVPANATRTLNVTFAPEVRGEATAALVVDTAQSALGPPSVDLRGTGIVGTPLTITANRTAITRGEAVSVTVTDDDSNPVNATVTVSGTDTVAATGTDGVTNLTIDTAGTFDVVATNDSADDVDYTADAVAVTVDDPTLDLSASRLEFGAVSLGESGRATLDLTNNASVAVAVDAAEIAGSEAEAFGLNGSLPDSIAADTTEPVEVVFEPTARGTATASLAFDDGAVSLDGTGVAPLATVTAAQTELTATAGSSTNGTVTVRNDGNAPLNATVSVDDSAFSLDADVLNISANASKSLTVTYAPTETNRDGNSTTLRIAPGTDAVDPVAFDISGIVAVRELASARSAVDFGNVTVGEAADSGIVVVNTGTTTETVTATLGDTTNFSLAVADTGPVRLAPGEDERLAVTANLTASGPVSTNLTVANTTDDTLNESVQLTALGRSPTLNVTATREFSETPVNSTSTAAIEIENEGDAPLSVSLDEAFNASERTHFGIVSGTAIEVSADETRTVTVGFAPQSTGEQTATLTLRTNDPAAPRQTVQLTGNGTATDLGTPNGTVDFGPVGVETGTATETMLVENNGTEFTVDSVNLSGPFSVRDQPATIPADGTATVDLAFDPTTTGERTGTLRLTGSSQGGTTANVTAVLVGTGRSAEIRLGQSTLRTGVTVAESGTTGSIAVENVGLNGTQLTVDDIALRDSQFALNTSAGLATGATIAGGERRTVAITFSPQAGADDGERTTDLLLNASTAGRTITRTIPVVGVVSAPEPTVSPGEIDIGTVTVTESALRTVTVSNDGGEPFTVDSSGVGATGPGVDATLVGSAEVVPGGETTVAIAVNRSTPGVINTTVDVPTVDAETDDLAVTITGTAVAPELSTASLRPVRFDNTSTGSASSAVVRLENTGNATLTVDRPTISGTDRTAFSLLSGNRTLRIPAGERQTITLGFGPETAGNKTATVRIDPVDDPTTEPQTVELGGRGVTAEAELSESAVSFGALEPDQLRNRTLVLTNNGTAALEISGSSITGSDSDAFSVSGLRTRRLGSGESEAFTVDLNTTAERRGTLAGQLTITTNESDVTSQLSGTVVAPDIEVDATVEVDAFGTTRLGTTSLAELAVNNTGNADLELTNLSVRGADAAAFSVVEQPSTVSSGASGRLVVAFDPSALPNAVDRAQSTTGGRLSADAQLQISSTDPDGTEQPRTVALNGEATTPDFELPRTIQFGETPIGQTTTRQLTVENTQAATAPLAITGVDVGGNDPDVYAATLADATLPEPLAPGESTTINVSLTPDSFAQTSATVSVRTNDTRRPVRKVGVSNTETVYEVDYGSVYVTYLDPTAGVEPTANVDAGLQGRNATLWSVNSNVTTTADRYSLNYTFSSTAAGGSPDNTTALRYINATTTADPANFAESTLRVQVSKAALAAQNATPEEVTIHHDDGSGYGSLDTGLLFETTQGYVYEVTADSYSVFAVGVPAVDSETDGTDDDDTDDGDDQSSDDQQEPLPGGSPGTPSQQPTQQPTDEQPTLADGAQGQQNTTQPDSETTEETESTADRQPTVAEIREQLDQTEPRSQTSTPLEDADTDRAGVTVEPADGTVVSRITFADETLGGRIDITEYGEPSSTLSNRITASVVSAIEGGSTAAGGEAVSEGSISLLSVSDIEPTDTETANSSATVELRVDADRVTDPQQVTVIKEHSAATGSEWRQLATTVRETEGGEITVAAEVEAFSLFAVAEVDDTDSEPDSQTTSAPSNDGSDDSRDGIGMITAGLVVALVTALVAILVYRRV